MKGVFLILSVATLTCVDTAPVFIRLPSGGVQVTVPGFAGLTAVTVELKGNPIQRAARPARPGADGNWRTNVPDVTNGNDDTLTYVIRYTLPDYVHEVTGSVRFTDAERRVAGPITRRYLERRATTVFHDDFSSGSIDLTKWTHAVTGWGGGINQVNMYTPEPANSYVKHNSLYIRPTLTVDHFGDDFLTNGVLDCKSLWGTCNAPHDRGCHLSGEGHIPPIMSAMLMSKTSIRYGRVTVKARLPKGDWLWPEMKNDQYWDQLVGVSRQVDPLRAEITSSVTSFSVHLQGQQIAASWRSRCDAAYMVYSAHSNTSDTETDSQFIMAIWLMPKESFYGSWPNSGEIDIMESRGNLHYYNHRDHLSMGRDYTHAAIHYGSRWDKPHRRDQAGEFRIKGTTFTDGLHSFWMDWTADYIKLGVDGHTVLAWDTPTGGYWQLSHLPGDNIWASGGKDAPFDRPFYLILNVAVGGGWFWQGMDNEPYPQPWQSNATKADQFRQFWKARHLWEPTWHGEDVAMRVRSVTLEQY